MKKNILKKKFVRDIASCLLFDSNFLCSEKCKNFKIGLQKDFVMGVAIGTEHILEKDAKANELIKSEYNGITAENIMKAEVIHPQWDKYNFDLADKFVDLGKK